MTRSLPLSVLTSQEKAARFSADSLWRAIERSCLAVLLIRLSRLLKAEPHRFRVFPECVIRWYFKQRMVGLRAVDVGQAVNNFARSRIGVTSHYRSLQVGRKPALVDYFNCAFITNLTSRNRDGNFGSDCIDSLEGLRAEVFLAKSGSLFFLAHLRFRGSSPESHFTVGSAVKGEVFTFFAGHARLSRHCTCFHAKARNLSRCLAMRFEHVSDAGYRIVD